MSDSLRPHGLQPTGLLRPWGFPGKSTGVGCHCLLRQKLTVTPQIKKVSLHSLRRESLWFFRNFFSFLSLFIRSWCLVLLSSTRYLAAAFMLASRHPGLEIRILSTVLYKYSKVHKSTTACRGCPHMTMFARCQLNVIGHVKARLYL